MWLVMKQFECLAAKYSMIFVKTNDINTVKHCQREFNYDIPSDILAIPCERFEARYRLCDNVFCKYL